MLAALAVVLTVGIQAVAAAVLWTLTVSPATGSVGVTTTFTFTATNLDALLKIGCFTVQMPGSIAAGDVWIVASNTAAPWVAFRSGQTVTAVVDSGAGMDKLSAGEWVQFAVRGTPTQPGAFGVPGTAFSNHACSENARALAVPPVITVGAAATPRPTPVPTPRPTPVPTPRPTATPLVTVPGPIGSAQPSIGRPGRSDRPTPRVGDDATPRPSATGGAQAAPPAGGSGGDGAASRPQPQASVAPATGTPPVSGSVTRPGGSSARAVMQIAREDAASGTGIGSVALGPLGVIDGLTVWAIPSAVVGGPGILVIVFVVLQTGAAAAWLPAVRRLGGRDARARRARTARPA